MRHFSQPSFLKLAFTVSLLLWASIVVTPAMAAQVTFSFTGVVDSVDPSIHTLYSIDTTGPNSVLTGFYLMDPGSASLDELLLGDHTIYTVGVKNLTFTLGTLNVSTGSTNAGSVFVSPGPSVLGESYITSTAFNLPEVASVEIGFSDGSGGFINNSLDLPANPPDLGSFHTTYFRLVFLEQSGMPTVHGALTMTAVPLPPAVILFGAGVVALIGLGAGNWRQKKHAD